MLIETLLRSARMKGETRPVHIVAGIVLVVMFIALLYGMVSSGMEQGVGEIMEVLGGGENGE